VLRIAVGTDRKETLLVRAIDVVDLGRDGFRDKLSQHDAIWLFERFANTDMPALRRFACEIALPACGLVRIRDCDLRASVRQAIERRELVGLRLSSDADGTVSARGDLAELRKMAARIGERTRGVLVLKGQQYRIVVAVDPGRVGGAAGFDIVSANESRQLLGAVENDPTLDSELRSLLVRVRERLLPADPSLRSGGFVLLRKRRQVWHERKDDRPALTPSQLAAAAKPVAWIEIELVDQDGNPVPNVEYRIECDDGRIRTGTTGPSGTAREEGLQDGNCKVSFPGLNAPDWSKVA
jgi:hypothetical protein